MLSLLTTVGASTYLTVLLFLTKAVAGHPPYPTTRCVPETLTDVTTNLVTATITGPATTITITPSRSATVQTHLAARGDHLPYNTTSSVQTQKQTSAPLSITSNVECPPVTTTRIVLSTITISDPGPLIFETQLIPDEPSSPVSMTKSTTPPISQPSTSVTPPGNTQPPPGVTEPVTIRTTPVTNPNPNETETAVIPPTVTSPTEFRTTPVTNPNPEETATELIPQPGTTVNRPAPQVTQPTVVIPPSVTAPGPDRTTPGIIETSNSALPTQPPPAVSESGVVLPLPPQPTSPSVSTPTAPGATQPAPVISQSGLVPVAPTVPVVTPIPGPAETPLELITPDVSPIGEPTPPTATLPVGVTSLSIGTTAKVSPSSSTSTSTSTLPEFTGAAGRDAVHAGHSALVGVAGLLLAWV